MDLGAKSTTRGDDVILGCGPLNADELAQIIAYWRAANFLTVAQIYLRANPLLTRPLSHNDIKRRLLGHWGTCPGLNLIYAHVNRSARCARARCARAYAAYGPAPACRRLVTRPRRRTRAG